MDRGAWRATVYRFAELSMTEGLSAHRQHKHQQDRFSDSALKDVNDGRQVKGSHPNKMSNSDSARSGKKKKKKATTSHLTYRVVTP